MIALSHDWIDLCNFRVPIPSTFLSLFNTWEIWNCSCFALNAFKRFPHQIPLKDVFLYCLCINFLLALLFVSQLLWTATGATIRSDTRHQTRTNRLRIKTYHEHTQTRNYCLEHTNDGPKHPRHEYFMNGVCLPQVETGKKWILKTGAYMLKRP